MGWTWRGKPGFSRCSNSKEIHLLYFTFWRISNSNKEEIYFKVFGDTLACLLTFQLGGSFSWKMAFCWRRPSVRSWLKCLRLAHFSFQAKKGLSPRSGKSLMFHQNLLGIEDVPPLFWWSTDAWNTFVYMHPHFLAVAYLYETYLLCLWRLVQLYANHHHNPHPNILQTFDGTMNSVTVGCNYRKAIPPSSPYMNMQVNDMYSDMENRYK